VPATLPPSLSPSPPPATLLAEGTSPRWLLTEVAGRWRLVIEGHPLIMATAIGHRLTRRGTMIGARREDGRIISVIVNHGLCRLGQGRQTAYQATLTVDRVMLHGCYVAVAPGERPADD
jgi:uncharacterized membrane protein